MIFARSSRQITAEVLPAIEALPVKKKPNLICVRMGTPEKALEFCELTSLPREVLYSDADNIMYDALKSLKNDPVWLMTDVRTPLAMAKRSRTGKAKYLKTALSGGSLGFRPSWTRVWQGGAFVFTSDGSLKYSRKDPATGDHVDLNTLLECCSPRLPPSVVIGFIFVSFCSISLSLSFYLCGEMMSTLWFD